MRKLVLKIGSYLLLILFIMEGLVRLFHLAKDTPQRFLDPLNVEKWEPNQNGFSVTGNRRQNFSEYHINNSGFNSFQEFKPTHKNFELALVGDSFIEGFHQDYYNSIGKKIEIESDSLKVYEFGYAGYDFADQLHLIHAYKNTFDLIDQVVIYIDFNTDLSRPQYTVVQDRLKLQSPTNAMLKKSKLLVYMKSIGLFEPPKQFIKNIISSTKKNQKKATIDPNQTQIFISNFKNLTNLYGYDKSRFVLLLDSSNSPKEFLNFLSINTYKYIDYHKEFKNATAPTHLIYDQHWNDYGRSLIAKQIYQFIR